MCELELVDHSNGPLVSIVIPYYNRHDLLRLTLETVVRQTHSNFEVICVDDGSDDWSNAVAQEFADKDHRVKCVQQENHGCASARNLGFKRSDPNSEFVIFLDSDDLWAETALETLVRSAVEKSHVNIFYSIGTDIEHIDVNGALIVSALQTEFNHVALFSRTYGENLSLEACDQRPFLYMCTMNFFCSPGAVLLRRSILDANGPFDESLKNCEDWDLWIRLTARYPIHSVRGRIFYYRKHNAGKSNDFKRMRFYINKIYEKLCSSDEMDDEQKQIVRKGRYNYYRFDALLCDDARRLAVAQGNLSFAFVMRLRALRRRLCALETALRNKLVK